MQPLLFHQVVAAESGLQSDFPRAGCELARRGLIAVGVHRVGAALADAAVRIGGERLRCACSRASSGCQAILQGVALGGDSRCCRPAVEGGFTGPSLGDDLRLQRRQGLFVLTERNALGGIFARGLFKLGGQRFASSLGGGDLRLQRRQGLFVLTERNVLGGIFARGLFSLGGQRFTNSLGGGDLRLQRRQGLFVLTW